MTKNFRDNQCLVVGKEKVEVSEFVKYVGLNLIIEWPSEAYNKHLMIPSKPNPFSFPFT